MDKGEIVRRETVEGFEVIVAHAMDPDPDLSWLGEYTNKQPEVPYWDRALERAVVNRYEDWTDEEVEQVERWTERNRHEWRYIAAGEGDPEYLEKDVERLEDYWRQEWYMVGVIAKAYLKGVELGHASVWGIESDSDEGHFRGGRGRRNHNGGGASEGQAGRAVLALGTG